MKQIIKNKYELHAILGIGIAFLLFFDSIGTFFSITLPILASAVISILIEVIQYNASNDEEYDIDKYDVITTVAFIGQALKKDKTEIDEIFINANNIEL